jgi:hypothetical protein
MSEQLLTVHCGRADVVLIGRVEKGAGLAIVAQVGILKRSGPVRWRLIPITASGRFA